MRKQSVILFLSFFSVFLFCSSFVISPVFSSPVDGQLGDDGFDQKMSWYMKLARFPSVSACIVQGDSMVWHQGYGYYDLDEKKSPSKDTIYCIASITKTVVGTALMQLYEQGLFGLDEDVNQYLPFELRNPHFPDDPITFRMLLSHTSSLSTNTQNVYYWMNFSGDPPFPFFPEPYLEEFLLPGGKYYHEQVWSDRFRPGEQAMYANVGFDLISFLVEIIAGEPFLAYCQQYIFDPLQMFNTSFNLSRLPIEQVAIPYQSFLGSYFQINELGFLYRGNGPTQPYWKMRSFPAGGLYTSVEDLSHFLIAHMNDGVYGPVRILEKDTVDLMHRIDPDNAIGYGLAWMQYPISSQVMGMGHGGDIMGVDTWMLYDPLEEIGVIYFANGNPAYSFVPLIGSVSVSLLLESLYEKELSASQVTSTIFSTAVLMNSRKNCMMVS